MNGQASQNIDEIMHDLDQTREEMEGTLHSIEQRFSSHYIADRFQEYVQEGTVADYVRNLSSSIAANPLPATLMGVSLAWLMFARNGNGKAQIGEAPMGETTMGEESGGGPGFTSKIKEKASSLRHRAGSMRERAGSATQQFGSRVHRATERTQETMYQVRGRAGDQARRMQDTYDWMLQEHPLALGMIGVAVGAALGATVSETEMENRTLGRARDRVMKKAGEKGGDIAQRAQRTAKAAAGAAKEEAKRQGLSPETMESAEQAARQTAEEMSETKRSGQQY